MSKTYGVHKDVDQIILGFLDGDARLLARAVCRLWRSYLPPQPLVDHPIALARAREEYFGIPRRDWLVRYLRENYDMPLDGLREKCIECDDSELLVRWWECTSICYTEPFDYADNYRNMRKGDLTRLCVLIGMHGSIRCFEKLEMLLNSCVVLTSTVFWSALCLCKKTSAVVFFFNKCYFARAWMDEHIATPIFKHPNCMASDNNSVLEIAAALWETYPSKFEKFLCFWVAHSLHFIPNEVDEEERMLIAILNASPTYVIPAKFFKDTDSHDFYHKWCECHKNAATVAEPESKKAKH